MENYIEKHIITKDNPVYDALLERCLLSNNVYNESLYAIRQHYFLKTNQAYTDLVLPEEPNKCLNYCDVQKYLSEHSENYKALSANAAQCTVKKATNGFFSFFKLLKKKQSGQYDKPVNIPKYLKSGSAFVVTYNKQSFSKKKYEDTGKIYLPKVDVALPIKVLNYDSMTQLSLVPKYGSIEIQITYRVDDFSLKSQNERYMAIDLGVTNLMTCVSNVMQSFIIDGRPVKSKNQWFNKVRAEEYQLLDKEINKETWNKIYAIKYDKNIDSSEKKNLMYPLYKEIVRTTERLENESLYRRNFISDYFHKASRYIVNQAVENDIRTIFIGLNKNWKQETDMSKVNNQNFVSIPHSDLIHMIEYKAKQEGIQVIVLEESYTSKASFLNNDFIPTYGKEPAEFSFSGYRKKRGLYKIKDSKTVINADVNGAFNILRKALNANTAEVIPSVKGFVFSPKRVCLVTHSDKQNKKNVKSA